MYKKIQFVFLVLFFVLLLIPFCFIETGNNVVSSIDNRELVEFPDFSEADWKNGLESYLSDRIGGRSFFINLNTVFNDKVFRKMVHPTYTYGTDGYVFFGMHKNIEYGEFHHQFALMVQKLQKYCEERGIKFYFLFNPEKISVYSRYLPKGVYYNDDWVRQLFSELDSLGVNYVDNSDFLREKGYSEQVFNRKYDAGHWNDLGMFYGLNNLFAKMSCDFPSVRELTFDDFSISRKKMTTLPVSHFSIDEDVPVFAKKIEVENLSGRFPKEIPLNSNFRGFSYLRNLSEKSSELPRILLFQGSYLNRSAEFVINNSSESITVHNYQNVLDADYYISVFKPDCVVFDVAEYVFSSGFFDLERMTNLEFPDSYDSFKKNVQSAENIPLQEETLFAIKKVGAELTSVCLEKNIPNVKNAYFLCDNDVFEFQNTKGALHFSRMKGNGNFESGEAVFEDIDGKCFRYPVQVRSAEPAFGDVYYVSSGFEFFEKKEMHLEKPFSITSGAELIEDAYVFNTNVEENVFNSLVIQLYDPRLDSYKALCASSSEKIATKSVYHHQLQTGEYILNVRANSNKSDEWVSYKVVFEQGKEYCFDFVIDSLSPNNLSAHGFHLFEAERKVSMETAVNRNFFDSVVIQLFDPYRNEYFSIDSGKSNLCSKIYTHERQTGDFIINIKSNSNKKGEMISYALHLENGRNYMYDLLVDSFKRKKVVIGDYNFLK